MSGEAVKVIVRVRPLNEREINLNCKNIIDIDISRGQCSIKNPNDNSNKTPQKPFFFDGSYDIDSTTEQLYSDIVYPLVENVTEGYNGTIFAYGQTGCGKSFTMQGIINPSTQRGVIPRAFDHIFETISLAESSKYLVHASYLEIYNEEIRDLLAKDVKAKLDLKEHPEKGVYVSGLSMHKVSNVSDCQVVMERGWKNRATGSTLMNVDSSRSHSIFTIYLEMFNTDENGENHIKAGKLNLVDLAGSERQSKTGATGDRLKEATKINLSLSALGNVISALVDGKSKHIPYRDSKLTRMLQDSLGGNTKTLMIACLSPADNNYEETLSTLRYANRAKNIQNKPKINEDPKDALLREFQNEINRLKQMLAGQIPINIDAVNNAIPIGNSEKHRLTEIEREKIKAEYETKLMEKEAQYSAEAADKAKLKSDMEKLKHYYDEKLMQLDVRDIPSSDEVLRSFEPKNSASTTNSGPQPIGQFEKDLENPSVYDLNLADTSVVIVNPEGNYAAIEPQRAVHVRTVPKQEVIIHNKNELLSKLQHLQSSMVGGEQINNEIVKDRHSKRKRHAEEKKKRLLESNERMEDDGIMLGVFEDIQDELRVKSKLLQKEKNKNLNLIQDLSDINEEFHKERCDYLESIRKLDRENKLLQMMMEKIQPCIKKSCNYSNFDKIKSQAKFDEESGKWILPPLKLEDTQLPNPDEKIRDNGDENYYRKLSRKPDPTQEYFQSRKSNQLLNQRNSPNNISSTSQYSSQLGYVSMNNSNLQKLNEHQHDSNNYSNDLRAAEVHGQFQLNSDIPNRRGAYRLDALQALNKPRKVKSSKYTSDNSMNDF